VIPEEQTMLTRLRLERFKNFKEAELALGPLTLLVGTNASGKSNVRDAFRFLHGISRGYTLAEVFGQKYGEGGESQWAGIRGGTQEVAYHGSATFTLEAALTVPNGNSATQSITYRIEVEPAASGGPRVVAEGLWLSNQILFESLPVALRPRGLHEITVFFPTSTRTQVEWNQHETFVSNRPVLSQVSERLAEQKDSRSKRVRRVATAVMEALVSMRFLDLSPEAMRRPSFPGQTVLGDRGENLSSVLQAIYEVPNLKETLVQWVQVLTPMDATDFAFPSDQIGRILVTLIEEDGQRTSAYSASDGTLRFLAMIAALLGPEPAKFYFIEELENGIHPTRLHLLLQLIEQEAKQGTIQMLATTHSPQLLGLLSPEALGHASLVYRLEGSPDAHIKRILDIPEARRVLEAQDLARLHAYGWLEDAVSFTEGAATAA
jgi:predicted ATPase